MERCPGGGIGRHAGLKILCSLERAGSSPAWGTKAVRKSSFFYLILRVDTYRMNRNAP